MSILKHSMLLLVLLLAACASVSDFDEPVVELASIQALPPEGFEQRLQLTLRVINPNGQAFTIDGIYSELSLHGAELVKGVSNQVVLVPAYGETMIELEASANLSASIKLLKAFVLKPPTEGLEYELSSKISIKDYKTVRVVKEGRFSLQG